MTDTKDKRIVKYKKIIYQSTKSYINKYYNFIHHYREISNYILNNNFIKQIKKNNQYLISHKQLKNLFNTQYQSFII